MSGIFDDFSSAYKHTGRYIIFTEADQVLCEESVEISQYCDSDSTICTASEDGRISCPCRDEFVFNTVTSCIRKNLSALSKKSWYNILKIQSRQERFVSMTLTAITDRVITQRLAGCVFANGDLTDPTATIVS